MRQEGGTTDMLPLCALHLHFPLDRKYILKTLTAGKDVGGVSPSLLALSIGSRFVFRLAKICPTRRR